MPNRMYDSAKPDASFPVNPDAVAGYVDGGFVTYSSFVHRYPNAQHLSITVLGAHDADCLDYEPGNANPDPGTWVKAAIAAGVDRPCVYADRSDMDGTVKPSMASSGLSRDKYRLWVAAPGVSGVPAGYDACQNQQNVGGESGYDVSEFNDDFFGGKNTGANGGKGGSTSKGVLTRGTSDNPDEDTWTCVEWIASDINWVIFTDPHPAPDVYGNFVYFMTQPELEAQMPSLILELSDDGTVWTATVPGVGQRQVAQDTVTGISGIVDNTSCQYQQVKTVKGKKQRPTVVRTPQSPTQIQFNMVCEGLQFCSGQTVKFVNAGPLDGVWIISNTTHNLLSDLFCQFTLTPPSLPQVASDSSSSSGAGSGSPGSPGQPGTAAAAWYWAQKLSDLKVPYLYGGGHGAADDANPHPSALDCSGSVSWVLHHAGMLPGAPEASTPLEAWGEPGKGKYMTVWANAGHAWMSFTLPNKTPMQGNTVQPGAFGGVKDGPTSGFRVGPMTGAWSNTSAGDEGANSGAFTARHWRNQ